MNAIRCAKRLDRGETLKHPFQTSAVASSWLNQSRDDRKSKTRPRNKHQIIRQIRVDDRSEAYMSHRENHEASVTSYVYEIRPGKRAFRRMLTSADHTKNGCVAVADLVLLRITH